MKPVSELTQLLAQMGPEIEGQLQPQLKRFFGAIIRGYLPQTWVFQTEQGTASLLVSKTGSVEATEGAALNPDVTVQWSHAQLTAALKTRDRSQVPPGPPPETIFHTGKGKTAFNFLRSRLGL